MRNERIQEYDAMAAAYDNDNPPISPRPKQAAECEAKVNSIDIPNGLEQLLPLFEIQEMLEFQAGNRVLLPGAMILTGLTVAWVSGEATVGLCATGVGCLLAPVTIGTGVAGLGMAAEGVYYGVKQKVYNPFRRN